ncbi:MAG: hypothetical protein NVS2B17_33700 [Candidatus Velthaea sp.]
MTGFDRARLLCLSVAALSFGMSGCRQNVDLAALAALSKRVGATQASFAVLSDDFRESCLRTIGWQRAAQPDAAPDAYTSCAEEAKAARQWQAANSVVTAYVAALGTLAGGSDTAGDYGLGNFAQTFEKLGISKSFGAAQQQAVSGAAAALLSGYFKAKRREALAPIVTAADADLGTIVATLEDVARTNYITQLTSERLSLRLFFEPNLAHVGPGLPRLAALQYRTVERNAQHEIDSRQGAVDSYVAALENIRTTHAQIAQAVSANRLADVAAIVRSYVATSEPQLAALQKAFK